MSSLFDRRTALLILGSSAGVAVLSACAPKVTGIEATSPASSSSSSSSNSSSSSSSESSSSSASSSPSPSINMSGSYKGDINFESVLEYERPGTFEPATREHAQRNTPKPKKPGSVTEKSLKGLRDAIAYTAATVEYAINTGDYSLIENGPMAQSEKDHFLDSKMRDLLQRARDGKRWVDNATIAYTLDEDKPVWDGEFFSWKRTFTMNYGKFDVEDGKVEDVSEGGGDAKRIFKGHLLAEYRNGSWVVAGIASQFEDDDDAVTPSSSPGASAGI